MRLIRHIVLFAILATPLLLRAQAMTDEAIKAALVLKFANLTDYISRYKFDSYVIVYVGSNSEQIEELQKITKGGTVKEKPITFIYCSTLDRLPKQTNLLFLSSDFNTDLESFWNRRNLQNTLLITEECENIYYSMINIFYDKQNNTASFQINKMAMNSMNLSPQKDIIINGGSFVDLRKEYKATSEELSKAVQEAENQKKLLIKNKRELNLIENELQEQNVRLRDQNSTIVVQSDKIKSQESILNTLSLRIEKQNDEISDKYQIINLQGAQIEAQQLELESKRQQLDRQSNYLKRVNALVASNKQKIETQELELQAKSNKIEQQRQIIWIVAISILVVIILLAIILKAFLDKRKINKELDSKQTELIEKQQEVLQQSEKLQDINTDLTHQRQRLEEAFLQLKDTQAQLVQQEKMASLGVLTAGLAHEINNPINYINSGVSGLKSIMNQIETLLDTVARDNPQEVADCREGFSILTTNIETGINRTSEIIRSLLTFSHADGETKKPANINANIDATLVILNNSYKHHITIQKNYGSFPDILCFPGRLNQVFMNILSNAMQSIEKKGIISIETRLVHTNIEIIITDNGKGISNENINRIFEPFFTTKDVGQGTGLGLSISYNIIKQHNGQIFVESEVGHGSTFTISLPAQIAH